MLTKDRIKVIMQRLKYHHCCRDSYWPVEFARAIEAEVLQAQDGYKAYEDQVELHNLTLDKVLQQEQYIAELLLFIEEAIEVYPTLHSDIETYKEKNKNAL